MSSKNEVFTEAEAARRSNTVWVTNRVAVPYDAAEAFGQLAYITKGPISGLSVEQTWLAVQEALLASKDTDYILPSGSQTVTALAILYFYQLHGVINLLFWDTFTKDYSVFSTTNVPAIDERHE